MKRLLTWAGLVVAGLVGILALAAGTVFLASEAKLNQTFSVPDTPLGAAEAPARGTGGTGASFAVMSGEGEGREMAPASDSRAAIVAWGEHIVTTRGCHHCHGEDMGGGVFAEAMPVMRVVASNLTTGGVGATYSDEDYARAIRHGVRPDGKPLLLMPSPEYYGMSDADVGSVIAYIRSLPPVKRELPASKLGPMGRALLVSGKLPLVSAEAIDHEGARPPAPPKGATAAYGGYLAQSCTGCHGPTFSGGVIPVVPPEWPPALNITPDPETGIGGWTREQFMAAITEGKRPDGSMLQPQFMPWPDIAKYEPDELEALWLYFRTVPAKAYGGR